MKKLLIFLVIFLSLNTYGQNVKVTPELLYSEILNQGIKFPDIVFAQALLESGNMSSKIFKNNYNLFGMRLAKKRKTSAIGQKFGYAVYKNWKESVKDYFYYQEYIFSKKEYTRKSYLEYIDRTYSETPGYVKIVNRFIKEYQHIIKNATAKKN